MDKPKDILVKSGEDPINRKEYMREYFRRYIHTVKWKKYIRERLQKFGREISLFRKWSDGRMGRMRMLMETGGCCIFCVEINPFELETHHPFGREERPDFGISLCLRHHHKFHWLLRTNKNLEELIWT